MVTNKMNLLEWTRNSWNRKKTQHLEFGHSRMFFQTHLLIMCSLGLLVLKARTKPCPLKVPYCNKLSFFKIKEKECKTLMRRGMDVGRDGVRTQAGCTARNQCLVSVQLRRLSIRLL
jgi:hypothetical protein